MSRRHVALEPTGGELRVVDLRSTNRTFVNGVAVVEAAARAGDVVWVGATELRVEARAASRYRQSNRGSSGRPRASARLARVGLGVAPRPPRARGAKRALEGVPLSAEAIEHAAAAVRGARPMSMNGYRIALARNLVADALEVAAGR